MSEYQYYEFQAIDKPLTRQQQSELRNCSSRATITSRRFVNEYSWGDLKAKPLNWMKYYFDAHVYVANWGTSRLMLRLPSGSLSETMLEACCQPTLSNTYSDYLDAFQRTHSSTYEVLEWSSNDDSGDYNDWDNEQSEWMEQLTPLRDELQKGDLRPLYLGWLARLCAGELSDDDLEPPLPAGLQDLTEAQQVLVQFLGIDPDWLAAAAQTSPQREEPAPQAQEEWLQAQTDAEQKAIIRLLLEDKVIEAKQQVRQSYGQWQQKQQPPSSPLRRRTVAQIQIGLVQAQQQRLAKEQQLAKAAAAREAAKRAAHLTLLAQKPEQVVKRIESALEIGSGKSYNLARDLTLELSAAMQHTNQEDQFCQIMDKLLRVHGKRKAWITRLKSTELSAFL